jgi:hypothetical protein
VRPARRDSHGVDRRAPARQRAARRRTEISDVRLLDKFQRLQRLNKRDREAVIILIDGVLASRAVESAIASAR